MQIGNGKRETLKKIITEWLEGKKITEMSSINN
jgi:hypothetical protein